MQKIFKISVQGSPVYIFYPDSPVVNTLLHLLNGIILYIYLCIYHLFVLLYVCIQYYAFCPFLNHLEVSCRHYALLPLNISVHFLTLHNHYDYQN